MTCFARIARPLAVRLTTSGPAAPSASLNLAFARPQLVGLAVRALATHVYSPKLDLVKEIRVDHDNVRDLWVRYENAKAEEVEGKVAIANTIIREASKHADAEELTFYKLLEARGRVRDVEKDRTEHKAMKEALHEADKHSPKNLPGGMKDYDDMVSEAVALFVTHADEEEKDQLPYVERELTEEQRHMAAIDFLEARELAPPRPHPKEPNTGGAAQMSAIIAEKPVDAAIDKAREHVPLKFEHPNLEEIARVPEP